MLGYLKKFNNLPAELREKVSNRAAMAAIEKLEEKYRLPLASLIMRVMVREIALKDLASALLKENLTETAAGQLAEELKEKIFFSLVNYLSPAPISTPLSKNEPSSAFKPPVQAATGLNDRPVVKGASFFFSPDDEQEVRELAKKIGLAEKTELPAEKIESRLEAIIGRVQINFGSADLVDRFRQILKTYLRGIRNKLETELTLTKPFLSGGLSFDADSAQKVMAMADKVNSQPGSPREQAGLPAKIRIPELEKGAENKPTVARDAPYDFSKLAKEKKISGSVGSRSEMYKSRAEEASHELAPLTPALPTGRPAAVKTGATLPVREKKPLSTRSESKVSALTRLAPAPAKRGGEADLPAREAGDTGQMPLIRRRFEAENLSQSQKVKVEDVKYVPRVMSPLDELKYLDLISFRRLDKDPLRAIDKIRDKMILLEEEGYGKKLEGIRLWRLSPINRLYLAIGHFSISENKPVDVIIEERKFKASDYLTAAEFEAIMDLNKSLRF